jgi:hypothetical protein
MYQSLPYGLHHGKSRWDNSNGINYAAAIVVFT